MIDILPKDVDLESEDGVDLRYFLLLPGHKRPPQVATQLDFNNRGKLSLVDDLEVPSQRQQSLDSIYLHIQTFYGQGAMLYFQQLIIAHSQNLKAANELLQNVEFLFGVPRAYKLVWAYALTINEIKSAPIHKELVKTAWSMSFRNPTCIINNSQNYYQVYHEFARIILGYIAKLASQGMLEEMGEPRLDNVLSKFFSSSMGHLLQGRGLQSLVVSQTSLQIIPLLMFGDLRDPTKTERILSRGSTDDIIIILLWAIITTIRCDAEETSNLIPTAVQKIPASHKSFSAFKVLANSVGFDLRCINVSREGLRDVIGIKETSQHEFPKLEGASQSEKVPQLETGASHGPTQVTPVNEGASPQTVGTQSTIHWLDHVRALGWPMDPIEGAKKFGLPYPMPTLAQLRSWRPGIKFFQVEGNLPLPDPVIYAKLGGDPFFNQTGVSPSMK